MVQSVPSAQHSNCEGENWRCQRGISAGSPLLVAWGMGEGARSSRTGPDPPPPPTPRVLPQHGLLQVPQHAAPLHLRHPHPLGKQAVWAEKEEKRGVGTCLPHSQPPSERPQDRLLHEQTQASDRIPPMPASPQTCPPTQTETTIQASASQILAFDPPLP